MTGLVRQLRTALGGRTDDTMAAGWLRLPATDEHDVAVKPVAYIPIYEHSLAPLRDRAFSLLELGVWTGDSLQMWRDAFPRVTVIGVDLAPPSLELGPRVHVASGDQADPELMRHLRDLHAPDGFDVIVDDASHLGITTARSLQSLYSTHLRPGGLYCIEDWGTGYLPDWHDGGAMAAPLEVALLDSAPLDLQLDVARPIPMPSHDIGAVGLIKRLIDHTARGTLRFAQPDAVGEALEIESMTIWDGIVALRKPSVQ